MYCILIKGFKNNFSPNNCAKIYNSVSDAINRNYTMMDANTYPKKGRFICSIDLLYHR